ncbi:hypothetical protein X749_30545 [Mesorhizobium sp. LNJC391B00]|nr:hypothetical protein X749_30545 [Mesorhizobium sp. LNJC391B00]
MGGFSETAGEGAEALRWRQRRPADDEKIFDVEWEAWVGDNPNQWHESAWEQYYRPAPLWKFLWSRLAR